MNNLKRTDLACESTPQGIKQGVKDGVGISVKKYGDFEIIETEVLDELGERTTGRKIGKYMTLCLGKVWMYDEETIENLKKLLSDTINRLLTYHIENINNVLVAGLGNRFITADSLGPLTIDKMVATHHIKKENKEIFDQIGKCELSLIAPGVVGQTGIEASDIIKKSAQCVKAQCIIVIDALAAQCIDRLSTTIQISDSGIHPGAGIGNGRKEISSSTMGIPVISIGVPTVVDSSTMVYDVLERAGIENITPQLNKVLTNGRSFFVSPKESDIITSTMAEIIASSITSAVGNK